MKTAMLVCLWFAVLLSTGGSAHGPLTKNLHRIMTRKEIMEYFGVSEHNDVPEYDVIIPYHSRHRRNVGESEVTHHKLAAFGQELHVTLTRNSILMNHGLTVKTQNADGTMTSRPVPENTFYLGHVSSDPGSVVAVSELGGLTGIIRTSRDTLLVRPLPARLARHVTDNFKTLPHLVIKISMMPRLRQRRSLDSGVKKYLEAALVVLTDMENKYGYNGTVQRLLVMANIVAGLFQDESIGATKIRYSINRILVLRPKELGIQSSDSNQLKLVRVIKWMRTQYGRQRPFDAVTFISDGPDRAVKSSANTMCRQVTASAVTDIGLGTAWYIAHGIGHNMGLDHDDDSADGADCPNYKYIMSSEKNTAPTSYMWSPCSRTRIQTFLNSGNRSWCLNDPPVLAHAPTLPPRNRGKLPGEIINGDQQCREAFSEDFKHASREKLRQDCGTLWCDNGKGTVLSADSRVADGTDCGVNKWCMIGFCVLRDEAKKLGKWSPCSRSCGGGVQFKEKTCSSVSTDGNAQHSCKGTVREWRICSRQPCPRRSHTSYRDLQCRQRNAGHKGIIFQSDPCGLYCGSGRRWRKAGNVDDGTRCSRYGLDVCIQGRCQSVGCDHELGSGARFDRCRVCDGNGTSCVHVTGNFTEQWNKLGPRNARVIVELPVGTLNAKFKEMERTPDAIGVQNSAGQYLSKGNSRTPRKGKIFHAAGARISLSQPTTSSADELAIEGPTTASLRVVLIRNGRRGTKGVRYHYCRPLFAYETTGESSTTFEWKTSNWSPCSVSCSTGLQTRDIWCVRSDDKTPASVTACGTQKMPVKKRGCNAQACIEK